MSGKCETEAGAQLEKKNQNTRIERRNKQNKTLDGGFDTDGRTGPMMGGTRAALGAGAAGGR